MATDIVTSDGQLSNRASYVYSTYLNASGTHMRLFTNNITPDPSKVTSDFVEASYPGYAAFDTTGLWVYPVQVVSGQYAVVSPVADFIAPTSGGSVTIYGVFCTDGSNNLLFSYLFSSPITVSPGDPDILTQATYDFWARVNLP